jgi:hypothetical protein
MIRRSFLRDRLRQVMAATGLAIFIAPRAEQPVSLDEAVHAAEAIDAGGCKVPDCSTHTPSAQTDEDRSASDEVSLVAWWLLDAFPEDWNDEPLARRVEAAKRIARLRRRRLAGRSVAL